MLYNLHMCNVSINEYRSYVFILQYNTVISAVAVEAVQPPLTYMFVLTFYLYINICLIFEYFL